MPTWELTTGEALARLMTWEYETLKMCRRILDKNAGSYSKNADAPLFAMSVRMVLRFALLVRKLAPRDVWSPIDKAIHEFEQATGGKDNVKNIRDIQDHLDAYLQGVGIQFPAGAPEDHSDEFTTALRPVIDWYESSDTDFVVRIAPVPNSPVLTLSVARETEAVQVLCDAIRDALATL